MVEAMGVMMRFGGISVSQSEIESELGFAVQWSRNSIDGRQRAQINVLPDSEHIEWVAIENFLEKLESRVARLITSDAMSNAELDIGLPFYEKNLMASITVPSRICYLAGQQGIAVTVTYYATQGDEQMTEHDVSG